ncbi:MAG TPA: ABC transporter ATP-binding protein [Aestuariivirga sp.]
MKAPAITLKGSASFGADQVFAPLEFNAPAGGWTCLLGSSGVGKSTLLRLLAGLDAGVIFDGTISCNDGAPLGARAALMLQSDMLLPWLSVLQNVTLGARLRGEKADQVRATQLLNDVGLAGFAQRMPNTLSGGQRQRVALARTLMEDRPVMLLDEPFSALDAKNRAAMQELSARLFNGRTIVLVTHDPYEAARLGTSVVVMTKAGLQVLKPPTTPVIRAYDSPDVIKFATKLLTLLHNESDAA